MRNARRDLKAGMFALSTLATACAADPAVDDTKASNELEAQPQEENELASTSEALIFGADDVGVIKESQSDCPFGLPPRQIWLDSENTNNTNDTRGWAGDTFILDNATFRFCTVPGWAFFRMRGSSSLRNYAVIRMGPNCPAGSVPFTRYFDGNDNTTLWCATGDEGGNTECGGNVWLNFCLFRASSSAPSFAFPDLGARYGVFGLADVPGTIASGWVYTDDEDSRNNNSITGDFGGSELFLQTSFRNGGTKLFMTRVR